ncbi:MAG: hypothetical protein WBF47_20430, partial [Xanthobacteraceae bacterium]
MAKHPAVVPIVAATIRLSEASCSTICRKLFTIHECVTQSHNWSIYEKDKASVLLREIMRRCEWHGVSRLLQGASRDMYKAVFRPWCGIEGHNGAAAFPELRWCDLPARIVCYRAGLSAPLATKQFEAYREQLEELWGGPVLIEIGAAIGAAPRRKMTDGSLRQSCLAQALNEADAVLRPPERRRYPVNIAKPQR